MRRRGINAASRPAVSGITVIGDFLRPDAQGRPGGMDRPITWLFNALKRQLHLASGLPVGMLTPTGAPALRLYAQSLVPAARAEAHWAACYRQLPWSDALDRALIQPVQDRFCVGYELPPYLMALFDEHGVPYLDLRLHPVRFLDDLLFAARASHAETQAALLEMAVSESEVLITAGLREAMGQFISAASVPDDTLIVLGQRPTDSSQIVAGGFFDAMPRRAEIQAICAHHAAVVLKPHPHEATHSLLVAAAGAQANVLGVIADNIYRMLSLPEVTAVLTVNSSIAYEAGYFGKQVYTLAPLPLRLGWRGMAADAACHVSLDDRVLSVDFWRTVLAPHAAVTGHDGVLLAPKPNRLRIALDSFWNYQEIDTDRIPPRPDSARAA
jgi:hypothetical protein